MNDWEERNKDEERQDVVIQDRRHTRSGEDEEVIEEAQVAAEPAPEPEPVGVPVEPEPVDVEQEVVAPGEVVEFRQPGRRVAPADSPGEEPPQSPPPAQSPEDAQLRMLFEMGLAGYLQGQLQLLLTFAVIYLGHQPNPATGLVSPDLEKARLAIDMLDLIVTRTEGDTPPEEHANLAKLVTELKMGFAQVAQQMPPEAPGPV